MRGFTVALALLILPLAGPVFGEIVISGRVFAPRFEGSSETVPMTAVRCFASLDGSGSQALGFRTWEMHPAGWYHLSGSAGNYTVVFSTPAHLMRPIVMTNIYTRPGEKVDRILAPNFDYAVFHDGAWDKKAATDYYQTFVAKGTSITHIGFKPVHDGVDGGGPDSQNMVLSIHKRGDGTPDTWPQVGPAIVVQNVDCGGPKGYTFSAGWNSGEVVTTPGEVYAAHLTAEKKGNKLQTFWRPNDATKTDCYRIGADGNAGWAKAEMWMAIGSDCDGLVIPYNKRVHKEYSEFAGGTKKWSQTYVAQGKSLASVILYAAVSGRQPSQNRQRLTVRVRKGGPQGELVGIEKIAIGNANYTGDASWGTFGLSYAPGEVPLVPGETYAIEFESLENWETLHDYVDIKNHPPDPNPGFNPYKKMAPDDYPLGKAFRDGKQEQDFDLDMQVIEYVSSAKDWDKQVTSKNLLANGDMEAGTLDPKKPDAGKPDAWTPFETEEATLHQYLLDGKEKDNRILRVFGGGATVQPVDGGYVQRVEGLSQLETYRLSGQVRSSWWVDEKHACYVGYDPTGQSDNPGADTIVWQTMPRIHGIFVSYLSDPIRPKKDAISVWLRGWTSLTVDMPFEADFDDFELRQVETGVPAGGTQLDVMSFNIRYGTANDGPNHWNERKNLVIDVLCRHRPDVVGLQEALRFQLDEIEKALPSYAEIGVGRDDGKEQGEYSAIFYLKDRFEVYEQGTFWLSDTPTEPGSRSWGNDIPRICTHARFVDKETGTAFHLFNTHFDHVSAKSRQRSAEKIGFWLAARGNSNPVILTGDLNAGEDSAPVAYLKDEVTYPTTSLPSQAMIDTFRVVHSDATGVGTFGGFSGRRHGEKIDYVLVDSSVTVIDAAIVYDNAAGRYPSDHYPVTARIILPPIR